MRTSSWSGPSRRASERSRRGWGGCSSRSSRTWSWPSLSARPTCPPPDRTAHYHQHHHLRSSSSSSRSSQSSQSSSWLQHQHWPDIRTRPLYQFACQTSDSPAATGHMLNDSTFSSKLRFKADWTTQQLYNQGQYGATWFGPGCILHKPQLFSTNQTCRSSYMPLRAACVWLGHQKTSSEKLFFYYFFGRITFKYTETNESESRMCDAPVKCAISFLGLI